MEVPNYPLYCYWGGEIVHKDSDITYRGGNQKFVFVHSAMTYSQVLNKLYEELSVDPGGVELKVFMRYPMAGAYVAIPLNDDNAVRAMWIAVTQSSSVAMQLFIEQVPKEPVVQTNTGSFPGMDFFGSVDQPFSTGVQSVGIGSFTRMLVDPHYVNDHLSQFRSPASSPNVGTSTSTQPQGIRDSLDPNNVDVFGDAEMNDTDEDDDEEVIEARDKAIKGSAPTSDFNEVAQVDPRLNNSWMSWLGNETYNNGGEWRCCVTLLLVVPSRLGDSFDLQLGECDSWFFVSAAMSSMSARFKTDWRLAHPTTVVVVGAYYYWPTIH
ncbi:uncharacterized protein LOC110717515 [Chenopodium quinoa]|uniref:uncharacterized protein LOC110717515 n=1 Tax=Chenopodium quinoa TaxID=63459 RepID=UPI000B78F481|nr:uncharacterized protein LOC110717515 [Chenopodium quinoa]